MNKNDDNELLTVYDEALQPLYTMNRKLVHMKGLRHRVIHLWFYDNDYLYFQQRSGDKEAFPLGYDITCAGHIDPDETALSACIRECKEELGMTLTEKMLRYIGSYEEKMSIPCGIDHEVAEVFLCTHIPKTWHLNDEVLTIGKIAFADLKALLHRQQSACHFYDINRNRETILKKHQVLIHEAAYYQWLLKAITA